MIVVDQRTDSEKLVELLHLVEQEQLDYKSETNVDRGRHRLDFVKDAVAMSNRPEGGYILMGVTNEGEPCQPVGTCQRRNDFDGAKLSSNIRPFVDGEVRVVTQWHELNGFEVLLVYVPGHRDGLPLPMTSIDQYRDSNGRDKVVFHEGQVFVREGTGNVPLRHAHWPALLAVHDEQVRANATATVEGVLRQLTLPAVATPGVPPLVMDMSMSTFAEAVARNLEAGKDISLRQFAGQAEQELAAGDGFVGVLDRLTVLILQGIYFERDDVARMGLDHVFRAYDRLGTTRADSLVRLEIITRIYVLGSLTVRLERWSWIADLVLRRISTPGSSDYFYSSWIRQGQVDASRAKVFPEDAGPGMMISLARALMQREAPLRPDVSDRSLSDPQHLDERDVLLNSLCQFDLLYCVVVAVEGKDHSQGYPACSAFREERILPIASLVSRSPEVRRELMPTAMDTEIAQGISDVFESARRESFQNGSGWWGVPNDVTQLLGEVRPSGSP